ncbi:MAG: hypothetical protein QW171_01030, partial [Candidatus Bilamarchaeaceae archaeon]
MKLEYSQKNMMKESEAEIGEPAGKSEERKSRLREFCSKLWDATKRNAATICLAAGAALAVQNCGGNVHEKEDADSTEILEENNEMSQTDETEDQNEEEGANQNCLGPGTPLEGEVSGPIANKTTGVTTLSCPDSQVSGDIEVTVGGEIENVLILGECPNDPGSVAAFGAQGSSVVVTPKYRIDMGKNQFEANLPAVSDELCPPPEIDNLPISR